MAPPSADGPRWRLPLDKHPLTIDTSSTERLRLIMLFVMVAGGGFVMAEPSPYEFGAALALMTFFLTGGLGWHRALMVLVLILTLYCMGLTYAGLAFLNNPRISIWLAVSWYLAVTALFAGAVLLHNTERRLKIVMNGWVTGALIAGTTGVLGYLNLIPMADLFQRYSRAKGTFNDPNVLAPFLVFPALLMLQSVMATTRPLKRMAAVGALVVFMLGILLSFSRAGWGHFALSTAIMALLMLITARSTSERSRIILLCVAGVAAAAILVIAIMQVPKAAALLSERASLDQRYDMGPMGRFGRHEIGWLMVYDTPTGFGPLQFSKYFIEDAHNVYLNSFFSGGWLAGIAYFVLVILTLCIGLVASLARTPWQNTAIALFATYVGLVVEGRIIDSEHWRHFYLVVGLIWSLGLAASMVRPVRLMGRPATP